MKILKASAGSGKTYSLSHNYINSVLKDKDPYAYRHILAVTFTNKATAEMKLKILNELAKEAEHNKNARKILISILHDYSAFAVSTIERFFQQALKAFSNEIGQFYAYQVELDKNSLISESADRLLDSISEDKQELKSWIHSKMKESLRLGDKFKMDSSLTEICQLIKSENYRRLKELKNFDDTEAFSKTRLKKLQKTCIDIITGFQKELRTLAEEALNDSNTGKKVKTSLNALLKKKEFAADYDYPKKTVLESDECSKLVELFDKRLKEYNTAKIIRASIYSLGLCGELLKCYTELVEEKNVLTLDDSSDILKNIIDNTDAPFIYEKLGVRYNEFLLDEFQDTSEIQWSNFLPLLRESEGVKGNNLIVGDVKQSIYRFRDSDWKLLGEKVTEEFKEAKVETLGCNWRSLKNVVEFNNSFFTDAAQKTSLSHIYDGLSQKVMHKEESGQEGYVDILFTEKENEWQIEAVVECIENAVKNGARYGDITILTRDGKSGSLIADELIKREIEVTSDDSLLISNSSIICKLLAILRCIDNPQNSISAHVVSGLGMELPQSCHSLVDMCDMLLLSLKERFAEAFEGEIIFINAFMDMVREWSENNGNQVSAFLSYWDGKGNVYIGSPEGKDAVRIMTIHKSKGLEFPYVIVPFAEKIDFVGGSNDIQWGCLECENGPLKEFNGLYPIKINKKLIESYFLSDYKEEMSQRVIDGLNIAYVAFTRAVKEMHIIAKRPSKSDEIKNIADLLYNYCGQNDRLSIGEPYKFSHEDVQESEKSIKAIYEGGKRARKLRASNDALDFFGEDGSTGAKASARIKGIILHKIMESVQKADDLKGAVHAAVIDGILSPEQGDEALKLLSERINSHKEWFDSALNEASIIDTSGGEHRPDRVIVGEDSCIIIDYKFGEKKKTHIRQVERYKELYRLMGYENISGYVWYVPEDEIISIYPQET